MYKKIIVTEKNVTENFDIKNGLCNCEDITDNY